MISTVTREPRTATNRSASQIAWPAKYDLFGVQVAASDYDQMVELVMQAAEERLSALISFFNAHSMVESIRDPELLAKVNRFDAILPDGQPVRWALNQFYGVGLRERVYGPELMLRLCAGAADVGIPVYLYGSTPKVIERLQQKLLSKYPRLQIAGAESPPFRVLTPQEDDDAVRRINESGARIVFLGLGCPKHEHFAADHADRINAVQLCVGAAFDFHAGTKPMAPAWMQRRGLEWLFRLCHEPRRLWRRYLQANLIFLSKWLAASLRRRKRASSPINKVEETLDERVA